MPRIEKFRMAGIRYDKMKKHYENTLFNLTNEEQPQHTLLTLVNGGGKGLLLQMLFQMMIPLTTWGKKGENHIDALFYNEKQQFDPYTFHVAAEWRLDTDPAEWLLTGICVTSERKAGGEDHMETEPQFFLYTAKYQKPFEWELESLPFYDHATKSAVGFEEWENWLKKHKSIFQVYSKYKSHQYYQFLKTYGIERSEWKHMREINRDEGGIEHYFKNGLDNFGLFHHLIIPEISNYMQDDKAENLVKIFKDNAIIAQKLPKLLKREEAYQEIHSHLCPLKGLMEQGLSLEAQRKDHEELASHIYHAMEEQGQALLQEKGKWEGEKEKTLQWRQNLLWAKENLQFAIASRSHQDVKNQFEGAKALAEDLHRNILEVTSDKENQELSILQIEHADVSSELQMIEAEIYKLEQGQDLQEEQQQLQQLEGQIQREWLLAEEQLGMELGKYEALQTKMEKKIKSFKRQRSHAEEQRIKLASSRERYKSQIQDHNTKAVMMEQKYGRKVNLDPAGLCKDIQKKLDQLSQERRELELAFQRLGETKEAGQLKRGEGVQQLKSAQEQLSEMRIRIENRLAQESQFHTLWSRYLKEDAPFVPFQEKDWDRIWLHLEGDLKTWSEQALTLRKQIWKHQLDTALVHESYWIPNDDVRRVKEALEEYHIPLSYGSELINYVSNEEKEQLKNHFPLLPYGLVIHKRDWEKVDQDWFSQTISAAPVPIFIRENMGDGYVMPFGIILDQGWEMAYHRERWEAWKEGLSHKTDQYQQSLEQCERQKSRITTLLDQVKALQKESYFQLEDDATKKERDIHVLQEELAALDGEMASIAEQLHSMKLQIQDAEHSMQNLHRQSIEVEVWNKNHEAHQENVKTRQQIVDALVPVEDQFKQVTAQIEQHESVWETWKETYWKWKSTLTHFIDELHEVLPSVMVPAATLVANMEMEEEPAFSPSIMAQLKPLHRRWKQIYEQRMNRDSELVGLKKTLLIDEQN